MPSVLVFDSGVGGLSVLADIRHRRADLDYFYALDNAAFPYGLLPTETLINRVESLLTVLVERHAPALVVIACNTASTVVLPRLRQRLSIPVVGVVPAIKPAAQLTQSGCIGLLATPATVERRYIDDLITQHAPRCDVRRLGSTHLVALAEQQISGEDVPMQALAREMEPWLSEQTMDTLVLGCTHFPLLKEKLARLMPWIEHWVDSGEAIARRVDSLLPAMDDTKNGTGETVYCTQSTLEFQQLWPVLAQYYGFQHWQEEAIA